MLVKFFVVNVAYYLIMAELHGVHYERIRLFFAYLFVCPFELRIIPKDDMVPFGIIHSKDVSLVDFLAVLVEQASELPDGFG